MGKEDKAFCLTAFPPIEKIYKISKNNCNEIVVSASF
jgi:hypothetical protein